MRRNIMKVRDGMNSQGEAVCYFDIVLYISKKKNPPHLVDVYGHVFIQIQRLHMSPCQNRTKSKLFFTAHPCIA